MVAFYTKTDGNFYKYAKKYAQIRLCKEKLSSMAFVFLGKSHFARIFGASAPANRLNVPRETELSRLRPIKTLVLHFLIICRQIDWIIASMSVNFYKTSINNNKI